MSVHTDECGNPPLSGVGLIQQGQSSVSVHCGSGELNLTKHMSSILIALHSPIWPEGVGVGGVCVCVSCKNNLC